jgi:hypothetical protein
MPPFLQCIDGFETVPTVWYFFVFHFNRKRYRYYKFVYSAVCGLILTKWLL